MTDLLEAAKRQQLYRQMGLPLPPAPSIAVQHNQLVEACYSMTLIEKRILLYGISKLTFGDYPPYGDDLKFNISVTDWCRLFKLDHGSIYDDLKKASEKLLARSVFMPHAPKISQRFNWFESFKYWDNEGTMQGTFTRTAMEFLCNLQKQFTQVDLLTLADIRSFHAIRLYELLSQFKATCFRTIAVQEFREIMDCATRYPKFSALKQWVIDPSIAELCEHTDIKPLLDIHYEGRNAVRLNFSWK